MKTLLMIVALLALALPARASEPAAPPTYVFTSTWTAAGTAGVKAFAFQNTSTTLDVRIISIEVGSANAGTVTSGPMWFHVKMSTQLVHGGTSQVSFSASESANATAPSYITVSTGPLLVQYEGTAAGAGQLPISRPLMVNADETATSNFSDTILYQDPTIGRGLLLPHGANRAIVLEQKQFGATDWTAGTLFARVVYTVK